MSARVVHWRGSLTWMLQRRCSISSTEETWSLSGRERHLLRQKVVKWAGAEDPVRGWSCVCCVQVISSLARPDLYWETYIYDSQARRGKIVRHLSLRVQDRDCCHSQAGELCQCGQVVPFTSLQQCGEFSDLQQENKIHKNFKSGGIFWRIT